jgi:aminoglycoside phosphotransferase (APT) family kinase protein
VTLEGYLFRQPNWNPGGFLPKQEEALAGGNLTKVVRIGDTVRRSPGPWTPTIHRLLAHVRAKGLHWVPEPFGFDESGREVLSFIPGDVPHEMPEWIWKEMVLTEVARAMREWHDATAGFSAPDAKWGLPPSSPQEVICHNDFAPYNCVFGKGRFVGAIDFDLCSPGSRIWDLAYTAYRFVPLMPGPDSDIAIPGERSPFKGPEMSERLNSFLASYGMGDNVARFGCSEIIRTAIDRLLAIAAWTEERVRSNGNSALANHPAMYRGHAQWLGKWVDPGDRIELDRYTGQLNP